MADVLEDNTTSIEDMVELFGSEDNPDEAKDKVVTDSHVQEGKDDESKAGEKKDESEGKEDKEEEPKIELEEEELTDIPKRQEILKAFPELFKKFPGIEHAIYREQQYTEVFPTVQDAKEAQEKVRDFEHFESTLLSGSSEEMLLAVKNADTKSFNNLILGFLPTLSKVDSNSYYGIIGDIVKNSAVSMYQEGVRANNDNLKTAAQILHQYAFGSAQITAPAQRQQQVEDPNKKALDEERANFNQQKLDVAVNDVVTRTTNIVKSNIDKYIDPKEVMTPYIRANASKDILTQLDEAIESDTRFKAILDKLWEQSVDDNFSEASKLKIRNALLGKAKTILPSILQRVRQDALKGFGKKEALEQKRDAKPLPRGIPANSGTPNKGKASEIPKGMKTLDYLMSDDV